LYSQFKSLLILEREKLADTLYMYIVAVEINLKHTQTTRLQYLLLKGLFREFQEVHWSLALIWESFSTATDQSALSENKTNN